MKAITKANFAEGDYVKGFARDVWPKLCEAYDAAQAQAFAEAQAQGIDLTGCTFYMNVSPCDPNNPISFHIEPPKRKKRK